MAVRADDIALVDLGQDPLSRGATDHARHCLNLGLSVSMIEFHRAWGKHVTAVCAGGRSELVEQVGLMTPTVSMSIDAHGGGGRP
jgi:hypothetical protein